MPSKLNVLLFSSIASTIAITLVVFGVQGIRQLMTTGECREVCTYVRILFGAEGLSHELLVVLIFLVSVVHVIGAVAAIYTSYIGLMVFVSAYILRFLLLAITVVVKGVSKGSTHMSVAEWRQLVLMIDPNQSKLANDLRVLSTIVQLILLCWATALMLEFRIWAHRRIKQYSLNLILSSWFLETNKNRLY